MPQLDNLINLDIIFENFLILFMTVVFCHNGGDLIDGDSEINTFLISIA